MRRPTTQSAIEGTRGSDVQYTRIGRGARADEHGERVRPYRRARTSAAGDRRARPRRARRLLRSRLSQRVSRAPRSHLPRAPSDAQELVPDLRRATRHRGGAAHRRGIRRGPSGNGLVRGPMALRSPCAARPSRVCATVSSRGCACTWSRCKRVVAVPTKASGRAWRGGKPHELRFHRSRMRGER
jgi:hypothetical protein